jgi:Tol biopolymer transport system component
MGGQVLGGMAVNGSRISVMARQVGFAPDGQHIVFMDPATGSLDVSAPDGTKLSHIGAGPIGACGSPIGSPDGQRIVYAPGIGKPQIIVVNQDGTHRQVVGAGCYPIFSTDGSQIAYIDSVGKMDLVNLDGTGHRVVPTHLGTTRIRTITSVSHGRAIIEVPPPSSCGCDEGLRNLRLSKAYVVDLATGATSDLPTNHGKIYSAFLTADGGMVLRTWTGDGTKPGTVVILAANGSVRATFDESTLSTNGAKVNTNLMDLVGYTP